MVKQLTTGVKIWIVSIFILFIGGLWKIWTRDFSNDNIFSIIKFFYSLFLFLAISVAVSFVISGNERKKERKKNAKTK